MAVGIVLGLGGIVGLGVWMDLTGRAPTTRTLALTQDVSAGSTVLKPHSIAPADQEVPEQATGGEGESSELSTQEGQRGHDVAEQEKPSIALGVPTTAPDCHLAL